MAAPPTPAPPLPPIVLNGLTKRFRNGVTAVDDLSLTVGAGEIWGLLGLNGAGKTTTLRMLVGLARPTEGEILVFGRPMTPDAEVLRQVGSMVDTPGFAPHLSGRANLELYWAAGGNDPGDGAVDRGLAIADLGEDADRGVRSYSVGMRQRLGLARALLGRPPLLILDEPTSGLDPRQVREVRSLIRSVAARGTTVLLSSHLLAEVEQVCTHVAVIDRGHLVTAGTVAELTGAADTVYLEVDEVPAAMLLLGAMTQVIGLRLDGKGLLVELAGLSRPELVSALVRARIGVETIMGRHRLEDAFLGILHEERG